MDQPSLADRLAPHAAQGPLAAMVVRTIAAIADAAADLSNLVGRGQLAGDLSGFTGANSDGDAQKRLDLIANTLIVKALVPSPVGQVASEENLEVQYLTQGGPLAVAIDPLDGSSNIAINGAIGTIFSIRPVDAAADAVLGAFASPGTSQLAAGFFLYGAQTTLTLTVGAGVDLYVLDRPSARFLLVEAGVTVPRGTREYAVNASNQRHWDEPVRRFVDECLAGAAGPLGADYNTRWVAALIADAHRILTRGGVYLYPADDRPGYGEGRLRLVYEAQPVAFLMEQAGGAASTGHRRIAAIVPDRLHQHVPLIFGAADEVARLEALYGQPSGDHRAAPLFGQRGLFRTS